jgi:hypothetical protein
MAYQLICPTLMSMRSTFVTRRRRVLSVTPIVLSVSLSLVALLGSASPAAAAGNGPTKPMLECVSVSGDGSYTAVFGSSNPSANDQVVPIGADNSFSPGASDRGQPTVFAGGRQAATFSIPFDGTDLTWNLNGRSVTASSASASCGAGPNVAEAPATAGLLAVVVALADAWFWKSRRRDGDLLTAPASSR